MPKDNSQETQSKPSKPKGQNSQDTKNQGQGKEQQKQKQQKQAQNQDQAQNQTQGQQATRERKQAKSAGFCSCCVSLLKWVVIVVGLFYTALFFDKNGVIAEHTSKFTGPANELLQPHLQTAFIQINNFLEAHPEIKENANVLLEATSVFTDKAQAHYATIHSEVDKRVSNSPLLELLQKYVPQAEQTHATHAVIFAVFFPLLATPFLICSGSQNCCSILGLIYPIGIVCSTIWAVFAVMAFNNLEHASKSLSSCCCVTTMLNVLGVVAFANLIRLQQKGSGSAVFGLALSVGAAVSVYRVSVLAHSQEVDAWLVTLMLAVAGVANLVLNVFDFAK